MTGSLNRYILILAKVDTRIPAPEQVHFEFLIPWQRHRPIVVAPAVSAIVPPAAATAAASATAVLIPTAAVPRRPVRLLPTIITGQVTLLVRTAATSSTPIVSLVGIPVLILVTSTPKELVSIT